LARDDAAIEAELTTAFERIFPPARGHVCEAVVQRWQRVVPFAHPGRHRIQPDLETDLGRVVLAGDYLGSWGNMEAAVESGISAAARAEHVLGASKA
jgi:oxygen-dependent protoporphyrinogen oxidase